MFELQTLEAIWQPQTSAALLHFFLAITSESRSIVRVASVLLELLPNAGNSFGVAWLLRDLRLPNESKSHVCDVFLRLVDNSAVRSEVKHLLLLQKKWHAVMSPFVRQLTKASARLPLSGNHSGFICCVGDGSGKQSSRAQKPQAAREKKHTTQGRPCTSSHDRK